MAEQKAARFLSPLAFEALQWLRRQEVLLFQERFGQGTKTTLGFLIEH